MANIKFTQDQWDRAKEYYEAGLSLNDIYLKTNIDRAAISRKAKHNNWVKNNGEKQQLILDAVRLEETKSNLNQQALSVHNELVNEKLRLIGLVNNFNQRAVRKATTMLDKIESAYELKALTEGVDKVTITAGINERHAKPTQINNTTQTANFNGLTDEDLHRESKIIRERLTTINT